jgi:hypothetical protein
MRDSGLNRLGTDNKPHVRHSAASGVTYPMNRYVATICAFLRLPKSWGQAGSCHVAAPYLVKKRPADPQPIFIPAMCSPAYESRSATAKT